MPSVTIVRGLPSCGKTTWAKEWVEQDPTVRARVSRADLAAMAGGDVSVDMAMALRNAALSSLLAADMDVVVDDIHLSDQSVQDILALARAFNSLILVYDMSQMPLDEVFRRNSGRDRPAPEDVIAGYYRTFIEGHGFPLPIPDPPRPPEPPQVYVPIEGPATYLVDIDGTMTRHPGGKPVTRPLDCDDLHEDQSNEPVIRLLEALDHTGLFQFIFITARPEEWREATEKWLARHVGVEWGRLFMRDVGDGRPDTVIKLEIFDREIRERYNVVGVFEDSDRVASMWRSLGLTVFQVAEGDF